MQKTIFLLVVGGPYAGVRRAHQLFCNCYTEEVLLAECVRTRLLQRRGNLLPEANDHGWQSEFIKAHEDIYCRVARQARESKAQAAVFIGSPLDELMYMPGGFSQYRALHDIDVERIYQRYDCVMYLPTSALIDEEAFETLSNGRLSAEEAINRDAMLREAWEGHHTFSCLYDDPDKNLERICRYVEAVIYNRPS